MSNNTEKSEGLASESILTTTDTLAGAFGSHSPRTMDQMVEKAVRDWQLKQKISTDVKIRTL